MSGRTVEIREKTKTQEELLFMNPTGEFSKKGYLSVEDINWLLNQVDEKEITNTNALQVVQHMRTEIKRALKDLEANRPETARLILSKLVFDNFGNEKDLDIEPSFYQLYQAGSIPLEKIHDYIEKWHNGHFEKEIYEYLGLTIEQYKHWVTTDQL